MQLFITQYTRRENDIVIRDSRVLHQCKNVLRYTAGEHIVIMLPHSYERIELKITSLTKEELRGICVQEFAHSEQKFPKTLLCALPNKHEKIEQIVQKCTEIGVDRICFFPSHRSQLKELSPAKQQRLNLISLEACEQSRGRTLPQIRFLSSPKDLDLQGACVCHCDGTQSHSLDLKNNIQTLVVGPEGGRSPEEVGFFRDQNLSFLSLGETVLRTETAAIVGGWLLKHVENGK